MNGWWIDTRKDDRLMDVGKDDGWMEGKMDGWVVEWSDGRLCSKHLYLVLHRLSLCCALRRHRCWQTAIGNNCLLYAVSQITP